MRRSPIRKSMTMKSKTDWAELKSSAGDVKPKLELSETDIRRIVRGIVRKGLKPLPIKASISLRAFRDASV